MVGMAGGLAFQRGSPSESRRGSQRPATPRDWSLAFRSDEVIAGLEPSYAIA